MTKLDLTETERQAYASARALTVDPEGRETLIGLTFEESVWYVDYVRRRSARELRNLSPDVRRQERDRAEALRMRHEQHRMQIIMAESEAQRDPQRH